MTTGPEPKSQAAAAGFLLSRTQSAVPRVRAGIAPLGGRCGVRRGSVAGRRGGTAGGSPDRHWRDILNGWHARVAVVTWSRRRVGGVEGYLGEFIPALVGAGHDVAFWCETDEPLDRDPIPLADSMRVICAAKQGVADALGELVAWEPDVIYAHGFVDPTIEDQVLAIAPTVFFVHSYYGMCISGGKTFTRPVVTPCSRVFGWPCLLHYFPRGCGGWSPLTMARTYRQPSARLAPPAVQRRRDAHRPYVP